MICFFKNIRLARVLFPFYTCYNPVSWRCFHITFKSMNHHFLISLISLDDYRSFYKFFFNFIHSITSHRKD
nr:MAG TPA: hypothetical protein [Caudoviricetes sp.]